ncbi:MULTISPECIES: ABC transporter ATP-binding protein [unclassified Curtobacterium]|uniref:ABC transporter ATP-binding protein n=1 Tax=unclassified Curtobacterium TaxID=257496 RepID=UPI000DA8E021|nr:MULTISPECIES: ABC transporter ATP-binding protein [unclassified Curtobacterium]PZE28062.1 ABC transporter ATP-binding protein [Curtobacterium sp. MCBD17_028]PZE74003.1 ABC transporter ATP-binding protein [Curtobacterium sp. MCBD17_019]PZF62323.1 ABC transporter ATP-binding protein [Curtobacterium sp. MCBD17_034]PZF63800.1 ABC transporter ATP-binding protein [Curtobacterium sp. MCBD17_013]PZM39970.1 ABC transporter ATP-binding protein [Curtobacterium sp. MCBD17_031]
MSDPTTAAVALRDVPHAPGSAKPDPVLRVDRITRRFGGMTAVDVDHLEVQRGAITALIGPNGAGKTTFFNLLTGFDKPSSAPRALARRRPEDAAWEFDGRPLGSVGAAAVARAGMVRTFQLTKALSRLTVLQNMLLGATDQPGERFFTALVKPLWAKREAEITEKARELLARFSLLDKQDDYAGSLSGGQRKLLEMARALMSDPTMIMLDEPMAGVNPALTQSLLGHIQGLRDDGMTVLFVEHDMHMVRHISDWVVVMAEGRVVAEGPAASVMEDQAVIDAYLGAHHDTDLGDDALLSDETLDELEQEVAAEDAAHDQDHPAPPTASDHIGGTTR